jgi:hypothetical protein
MLGDLTNSNGPGWAPTGARVPGPRRPPRGPRLVPAVEAAVRVLRDMTKAGWTAPSDGLRVALDQTTVTMREVAPNVHRGLLALGRARSATILNTRGLTRSVTRLITPPLRPCDDPRTRCRPCAPRARPPLLEPNQLALWTSELLLIPLAAKPLDRAPVLTGLLGVAYHSASADSSIAPAPRRRKPGAFRIPPHIPHGVAHIDRPPAVSSVRFS